jgi:isopenicillin-N N-acyltransferase-like protein
MTINNLNSVDARIGIVWPVLVRRALRERTAAAARDVVLGAPLGSGHHYFVADGTDAFGVETSGTKKKVTQSGGDRVHKHTNHCLDPEMADTCRILSTSTTKERLAGLDGIERDGIPDDALGIYRALARVSMARDPRDPHKVATCGAIAMDLARRRALVAQGPVGTGLPLVIDLDRRRRS